MNVKPSGSAFVFTDEFQRGLAGSVADRLALGMRLPVGVAEFPLAVGDGNPNDDIRELVFRGIADPIATFGVTMRCADGCGSCETRRILLLRMGVFGSRFEDIMTEDAGEDPGVSIALPAVDLSLDNNVETESRSC